MDLVFVFLAGFLAAGVDGALGMGFGPTAAAVLLATGMSPHSVAATVNLAKGGAGVAGGLAHWRYGNVSRRLVLNLAVPGAVGAVVGATVLSTVDGDDLRPALAALLSLVGLRMLWRFVSLADDVAPTTEPAGVDRGVALAGLAGGCTNGMIGAWGPVVTPYLAHRGFSPRIVVGSVNTAEIAVAVVAFGTLVRSGTDAFRFDVAAAMLCGGVLAAPVAAWAIARIPPRVAGLCLAGLLLLTQTRELADAAGIGPVRWIAYAAIVVGIPVIARARRRPRRVDPEGAPATSRSRVPRA